MIGVVEARTVVVRMVVGVVAWMSGRVSDRVLVHELVVILDVRKVPLANYLPSLAVAPLLTHWWR